LEEWQKLFWKVIRKAPSLVLLKEWRYEFVVFRVAYDHIT
jgi:hypothetical protein